MVEFEEDDDLEYYSTDVDDDDNSYVMVDSEEFRMIDSDEEDSFVKTEPRDSGIESEDLEDHEFYLDERLQFRTIAHQKECTDEFEFPANIKRKEEMEIEDVVRDHVLPFLPAKSLFRFKTVSKHWDRWISSPFLAHKQSYLFRQVSGFFSQSAYGAPTFTTLNPHACGIPSPSLEFLPEPIVIRSSCNGLLLCQGCDGENVYYVCNPVNKEWKALPLPDYYHLSEPAAVLVFEPSVLNFAADFQIICAFPSLDVPVIYFEIYSSETNSWRCSAANCIELGDSTLNGGFYTNRMAYWETSSGEILAFDMKTEICGILTLPRGIGAPNGLLSQMRGELCYIQACNRDGNVCILDIYGGLDMSLKRNFAMDLEHVGSGTEECRVLSCVSDDIVVVLVGGVVYSYHLSHRKVEVISREEDFTARYLPYLNSLASVPP